MAISQVEQELRDKFFAAMMNHVMSMKTGPDQEVTLEALIEASQMLTEHLEQELAEVRQEQD